VTLQSLLEGGLYISKEAGGNPPPPLKGPFLRRIKKIVMNNAIKIDNIAIFQFSFPRARTVRLILVMLIKMFRIAFNSSIN